MGRKCQDLLYIVLLFNLDIAHKFISLVALKIVKNKIEKTPTCDKTLYGYRFKEIFMNI